MALGDDDTETHSAKVYATMREWLLKGNLGVVKQCCQKVRFLLRDCVWLRGPVDGLPACAFSDNVLV